ncbi:DNA -binding domain-containing protein [Rhizorhabdus dicambivorans]|uniref:DNA -binding domain-containing protein n=1 Tax=Rhizorhabdus dicambivorans TaxID=1850238 RepID=UPI0008312C36|nr:DUF2285 domain-containing protein [Rhizorhabdus dicambivorans]
MLRIRCEPCAADDPWAFRWPNRGGHAAVAPDRQHVRLDGAEPLRLDVVAGSILDGPVRLEPALCLDRDVERQILAIRRLRALLAGDPLPVEPDPRLPRLVLALRVLDARREGASLRAIGTVLLDNSDWPGEGEWMKSAVRRLVALAGALQKAGPRGVLQRRL